MGGAGATSAFSGCLVVRLRHWGVCTGFLGFGIGRSGCGLFSLETLVFLGVRGSIPLALMGPGGPCVNADALVVLLDAYRGAGVGACAAGPGLSWSSLDFLLGGFWKDSTDPNNPICYLPT